MASTINFEKTTKGVVALVESASFGFLKVETVEEKPLNSSGDTKVRCSFTGREQPLSELYFYIASNLRDLKESIRLLKCQYAWSPDQYDENLAYLAELCMDLFKRFSEKNADKDPAAFKIAGALGITVVKTTNDVHAIFSDKFENCAAVKYTVYFENFSCGVLITEIDEEEAMVLACSTPPCDDDEEEATPVAKPVANQIVKAPLVKTRGFGKVPVVSNVNRAKKTVPQPTIKSVAPKQSAKSKKELSQSAKLDKKLERRSTKAQLKGEAVQLSEKAKLEAELKENVLKSVNDHNLGLIEYGDPTWVNLLNKVNISQLFDGTNYVPYWFPEDIFSLEYQKAMNREGLYFVRKADEEEIIPTHCIDDEELDSPVYDPSYAKPTVMNHAHLVNFPNNVGYAASKRASLSLKGGSEPGRTNIHNTMDEREFTQTLLDIALKDELMSEVELANAAKVEPFNRLPLGAWIERVTSWFDPVESDMNRVVAGLASLALLKRMRRVFEEAYQKMIDEGVDPESVFTRINGDLYLRSLSVEKSIEWTTLGKHFGFPFSTSQWSGEREGETRMNGIINDYLYSKAKSALENKTYYDDLQGVVTLMCRISRGKHRKVDMTEKVDPILAKAVTGNVIPVIRLSTEFAGFNGGENIGDVISVMMAIHQYASEMDMEDHDKNAKAGKPYSLAVLAHMCDPDHMPMWESLIEYEARYGLVTPYGVIYPKSADQLLAIVSGGGVTSIIGGFVTAWATEYGNIKRLLAGKGFSPAEREQLDEYMSTSLYSNAYKVIDAAAAKASTAIDYIKPVKNFVGDELDLQLNAYHDLRVNQENDNPFDGMISLLRSVLDVSNMEDHHYAQAIDAFLDLAIDVVRDFQITVFGDDIGFTSNFEPKFLWGHMKEIGLVVSEAKSNTHRNLFYNLTTTEIEDKVEELNAKDPSLVKNQRMSFLGYHYFQHKAAWLYQKGEEWVKAATGKFSIMRGLAPKLIYQEYLRGYSTNAQKFEEIKQAFEANERIVITKKDLRDALGTVMKLNIAANNDCFEELVHFVRKGCLLKLHTTLIKPLEEVLLADEVRSFQRVSRTAIERSGIEGMPIMKLLYAIEQEEGIVSLQSLQDMDQHSLATEYGIVRMDLDVLGDKEAEREFKLYSKAKASKNRKERKRSKKSPDGGNKVEEKKERVFLETPKAINSVEKSLDAVLPILDSILERSQQLKDLTGAAAISLKAKIQMDAKQLVGKSGNGRLTQLIANIKKVESDVLLTEYFQSTGDSLSVTSEELSAYADKVFTWVR